MRLRNPRAFAVLGIDVHPLFMLTRGRIASPIQGEASLKAPSCSKATSCAQAAAVSVSVPFEPITDAGHDDADRVLAVARPAARTALGFHAPRQIRIADGAAAAICAARHTLLWNGVPGSRPATCV